MREHAHEREVQLSATSEYCDADCSRCGVALLAGEQAVICPRCKRAHHVKCWKVRGGCATLGCRQLAVAILPDVRKLEDRLNQVGPIWQRRPAILLFVGLLSVALLAGLLIQKNRSAVTASALPELTLMAWGSPMQYQQMKKTASQFETNHAQVRVRVDLSPVAAYEQKLIILMAAKDAPDVFVLPTDRVGMYAQQGALVPLDAFVSENPTALGTIPAARMKDGVWNGKRYAVASPSGAGVMAIGTLSRHPNLAWELLTSLLRAMPPPEKEPLLPRGAFGPLGPGF